MKNSKAILLAIFTSLFAVLTVVNISLASSKSSVENTLDMLEIMTRAFDEGGEGQECSPNECTTPENLWAKRKFLNGSQTKMHVVHLSCGFKGPVEDAPSGWEGNLVASYTDCIVGYEFTCEPSWPNYCCPSMMKHCFYGYECTGGDPD